MTDMTRRRLDKLKASVASPDQAVLDLLALVEELVEALAWTDRRLRSQTGLEPRYTYVWPEGYLKVPDMSERLASNRLLLSKLEADQ